MRIGIVAMKVVPPRPQRNISPYLLKRLRSFDEAMADIESRSLPLALRRQTPSDRSSDDGVDEPDA